MASRYTTNNPAFILKTVMKTNLSDIAAIVLAGGESKRLRQPKQLVKYRKKTLIEITLEALINVGIKRRLIVTGKHHQLIADVIPNEPWVINQISRNTGIGSSISLGAKTLVNTPVPPKALLILLSDQPFLTATHLKELISALNSNSKNIDAVATLYDADTNSSYGVPAAFSQSMFNSLQTLSGDQGAKNILNSPKHSVIGVRPDFDTRDIDTNNDLFQINDL